MSTNDTTFCRFIQNSSQGHCLRVTVFTFPLLSRVRSKMNQLNPIQVKMVKEKSDSMAELVPPQFKIDLRKIVFVKRIGSGSFGDCYQGTRAGRPVAIKKMRAGSFAA